MLYPKSPFQRVPLVEAHLLMQNKSALEELLPWLCYAPTVTTYRVNLLKCTVESFMNHLQQQLMEKYGAAAPQVYQLPNIPEVVCIGKVHNSLFEDIERKEVVVDVSCAAAIMRGAHIFAPGILSMESNTKLYEEVSVYADLEGKCKRGLSCRYNSTYKLFIGIGIVQKQRYQLFNSNVVSAGIAVEMKANISGVPTLGNLSSNTALLQNLPSIVCIRILDPQPGELILDMCAAPGNKTTHIAEMMHDEGLILALDKTETKIKLIQEKIVTNELNCIRAIAYDSRKSYSPTAEKVHKDILSPPFAANTFDRILLDAPCSSLGNRPVLASNISPSMLASFPKVQMKLFENAVHLLKSNGVLVYSTCTISEAENELMVSWALHKFSELTLVDTAPKLGGKGLPNLGLDEQQRSYVQRFGPANSNTENIDTIGFFIAKFVKK